MAATLPPPPVRADTGSFAWVAWYQDLYTLLSTAGSVSWDLVNKAGSSIADLQAKAHNLLTGVLGTGAYHISSAEATIVTSLASGVYTPTLTNVTNVAASTAYQCQYMRVGSVVTVSGRVDIDATAAGAEELGMSLPVASNFGALEDCGGTAAATTASEYPMYIQADIANNRAAFRATKVDTSNHAHYFSFTYRII